MADKSAFVPVDAIKDHKSSNNDVDMDAELFGKKDQSKKEILAAPPAAPCPPPSVATPTPAKPSAPVPPAPAPAKSKFTYKKSTTYQKTYAGAKK